MRNFFITVLLIGSGYCSMALAVPVALNGQYSIDGKASVLAADGTRFEDSFSDDNLSTPLPLLGTVSVGSDAGSTASALAVADSGSLLAITDTVAGSEFADAGARAIFLGDFTAPGQPLRLRFDIFNDAQVGGVDAFTQAVLSFALAGAGQVLLNETLTFGVADLGQQIVTRDFFLPAGTPGLLDIALFSRSGGFDGAAAGNIFSVAFGLNTVPEPATWFLLIPGLAGMALIGRRRG
ncbi:MAG: PEP-CTERM sorting domain-containing protein [Verrucomicrobiota bacterium]